MTIVETSAEPARTFKRWKIGDVTITRVVESQALLDLPALFPKATVEAVLALPWLRPHFVTPEGRGILSIHALVVDTPTKRIIVDTCVGNDKDRGAWTQFSGLQTGFLADLHEAGFPRDSFDVVLCTHMHADHVGWNTMCVDSEWVPTFPTARYLLNRTEYEHWAEQACASGSEGFAAVQQLTFADSVQPLLNAGLLDFVDGTYQVCDEVALVPTVGHSPGHVSVCISSRGEEALITGDMTHHPSQLAHVDWAMPGIDFDCDKAIETRLRVFSEAADRPILVIGTHWAGVTAGRIKRDGSAFRLEF